MSVQFGLFWLFFSVCVRISFSSCASLNYCSGHGVCNTEYTCDCFNGWGNTSDVALYHSPDCSLRTCPTGKAWGDIAATASSAHHYYECSNRGKCNRISGECECHTGFGGPSCSRMLCPNGCSGHGSCFSMQDIAKLDRALPLSTNKQYGTVQLDGNWDYDVVYGCVCDSTWDVGLASGETQQPEWFGPDCSQQRCPSADDPTTTTVDETNCTNVLADRGTDPDSRGATGNLCHVDCANRGVCDYSSGVCSCFSGAGGIDCSTIVYE